MTPQSYFCPHRLVCPGAHSCSPQFLESQLSGVDSSDAKMPKDEHSSDPGCGVTFDRASWQPFYAPIGGTFFHSTWVGTMGRFLAESCFGAIRRCFNRSMDDGVVISHNRKIGQLCKTRPSARTARSDAVEVLSRPRFGDRGGLCVGTAVQHNPVGFPSGSRGGLRVSV